MGQGKRPSNMSLFFPPAACGTARHCTALHCHRPQPTGAVMALCVKKSGPLWGHWGHGGSRSSRPPVRTNQVRTSLEPRFDQCTSPPRSYRASVERAVTEAALLEGLEVLGAARGREPGPRAVRGACRGAGARRGRGLEVLEVEVVPGRGGSELPPFPSAHQLLSDPFQTWPTERDMPRREPQGFSTDRSVRVRDEDR